MGATALQHAAAFVQSAQVAAPDAPPVPAAPPVPPVPAAPPVPPVPAAPPVPPEPPVPVAPVWHLGMALTQFMSAVQSVIPTHFWPWLLIAAWFVQVVPLVPPVPPTIEHAVLLQRAAACPWIVAPASAAKQA